MKAASLWLAVGAGGALGAMARHAVSRIALSMFGPGFPWATLIVNVVGSFLMGLLIVWLSAREPASAALRSFFAVGLLGAFTTFSTYSLDAVTLLREKAIFAAGAYIGGSVLFSIVALLAGMAAARWAL